MCKHLQVSASGYYDWSGRAPSKRTAANVTLLAHIEVAHAASDATYGMPSIRAELADQGVLASHKRIATVMRLAHIRGVSRRRAYVVTTTCDKRQRPAPDLVKRQFVATQVNQLWVADMTYVPTWSGFLYLAVVTDVYSRKVVGWAFGAHMTADLVIAALNMALLTDLFSLASTPLVFPYNTSIVEMLRQPIESAQYTSIAFGNPCKEMGVRPSMRTLGDAYDNAMAESFFASLECELIARRSWKTKTEARLAVFT